MPRLPRIQFVAAVLAALMISLGPRDAGSAGAQEVIIEAAGDALLDYQAFHLPQFATRQLIALRGNEFSMIGARVLRYSSEGELRSIGADDLVRHQIDNFDGLIGGPGDSVYAWSQDREIAAFSSDGTVLWTHPGQGGAASPPVVDAADSIYFVRQEFPDASGPTLRFVKLLRDGSEGMVIDLRAAQGLGLAALDFVFTMRLFAVPGSDEMVLVGNMNFHTAIAMRIRPDGSVRWYWKAPGRMRSLLDVPSAAVQDDGSLLIGVQNNEDLTWDVSRVNAQGQVTSTAEFETGATFTNSYLVIDPAGRLYQLNFAPDGMSLFIGRDPGGQQIWSLSRPDTCRVACYFDTLGDGDLLVFGQGASGAFQVERYSRSGEVRFDVDQSQFSPNSNAAYYMGETAEGNVLLGARRRVSSAQSGQVATDYDDVLWIDTTGAIIRTVRQPSLGSPPLGPAGLAIGPSGDAVVVSPATDSSFDQASVVTPGAEVFASPLVPRDSFGPVVDTEISNGRLIVGHRFAVRQYAELGLGELLATTPVDGRLSRVRAFESGSLLVEVLREHPEIADIEIPGIVLLDQAGANVALPIELSARASVVRSDPAGVAVVSNGESVFALSPDGSTQPHFEPLGEVLWEVPEGFGIRTNTTLVLPEGDKLVFQVLSNSLTFDFLTHQVRAHLARLSPQNAVRWRQLFTQAGRLPELDLMLASVSVNAQGQILITSSHTATNRVVLRALDAADGSVVTRRVIGCPGIACKAGDFSVDALGVVQGLSFGGGPTDLDYKLIRIDNLWDISPTLPIAAASGLWYSVDTSGEGMAIQYDAPSNVLAASWYTYARVQENEPKQLRWYTLTGEFDPEAPDVGLEVYEVRGGVFDSPPVVPAASVGHARIRLVSCDRLEVRLELDAAHVVGPGSESGGQRAITLSRLIPAQENCVDAEGTATQSDQAFDFNTTGAWFEPNSSGQGLFLYRFRQQEQDAFVFAGAWFTHDVAGVGGTENPSPHWFTLLGSPQSGDAFDAEIFQSLGGHFGGTRTRNARSIGTASITISDCQRMVLSYQFDGSAESRGFGSQSGTIDLRKIAGTCPPGIVR